jgi:hypothetical protein
MVSGGLVGIGHMVLSYVITRSIYESTVADA